MNYSTLAPWRVLGIDKSAAKLTVRLTPHRHPRAGALGRRAKHTPRKRQQEQHGKPNRKRGGAEPSPLNRFGDRLPLFPPRMAFFHCFSPFIVPLVAPLEFAFSVGYGSIVPRGSQRSQNRR